MIMRLPCHVPAFTSFFTFAVVTLVTTMSAAGSLAAQPPEPSLAVGVAVPLGGLGEQRVPGPVLRGGLTFGDPRQSRVRARVELEAGWIPGRDRERSRSAWARGGLRSVTAAGSLLMGATAASVVAPYAVVGLALERLAISGQRNPYGTTAGVRAGIGARWRWRERALFAELTPHIALTDYGTGGDFNLGVRVPVVMGVSF